MCKKHVVTISTRGSIICMKRTWNTLDLSVSSKLRLAKVLNQGELYGEPYFTIEGSWLAVSMIVGIGCSNPATCEGWK